MTNHKTLLGYKIFDTLQDFYNWQGYNGNPVEGTVNQILGYSTANQKRSIRFTKPIPHPSAITVTYDSYEMPVSINGDDQRIICQITGNCPEECIPNDLIDKNEAQIQGWYLEGDELE